MPGSIIYEFAKELKLKAMEQFRELVSVSHEGAAMRRGHPPAERDAETLKFTYRKALLLMPCRFDPGSIDAAFDKVGYPYGLQSIMKHLQENEQVEPLDPPPSFSIGQKVQKRFLGDFFKGTVVSTGMAQLGRKYHIHYEDGDQEDIYERELWQVAVWNNPLLPLQPRTLPTELPGRSLHFLELFSGKGVVSQACHDSEYLWESVDVNPLTKPTMLRDIMCSDPSRDLKRVPDFIWVSLPCETYSNLAGNLHRVVATGQLDISQAARDHNLLFLQVVKIIMWAKARHPHVAVVFENPAAKLAHMPLMQMFAKCLGLERIKIHYCAFGRPEKKPTHLWSNIPQALDPLAQFVCNGCKDHLSIRDNKSSDFAEIPILLAREVAKRVYSDLTLQNVHMHSAADP